MIQSLWGGCAALSLVISLFFVKYWRVAHDRLFAAFAAAFAILSVHWFLLGLGSPPSETRHYVYVPRFVAFIVLIVGVIDKNRSGASDR